MIAHASDLTLALQSLLAQASPQVLEEIEETLASPVLLESHPQGDPGNRDRFWTPQPGPQTLAYESQADLLFYGGAAGGGKSDLLLGLALTRHQRSIIYRKEATQNQDFVERLTSDLLQTDRGWSSKNMTWNLAPVTGFPGHRIVFGGLPNPGDEQRYKGRPNDFIGFDEGVDFTEFQIRFLSTWNRSTLPKQRCRIVIASNPPAPTAKKHAANGLWLIDMFAPWLDPQYKDPLGLGKPEPGELRWYVKLPGHTRDQEWPDGVVFLHEDLNTGKPEIVIPQSRTFIPASVYDNAYLRGSSYLGTLQSLHEPLRSIMLHGDFTQALSDQPAALFPAQWLRDAVQRWKELQDLPASKHPRSEPMTSLGLDVARGGADSTVGAPRYGAYFDTLKQVPGSSTPDGPTGAGYAVAWARDGATIIVDANGPGGAVYDHLNKTVEVPCRAYIGSSKANLRDRTGKFTFPNLRSQAYWKFREALDPSTPGNIALPDDPELIAELSAHSYEEVSGKIKVTPKEQIQQALGRSPDRADAVIMAWTEPHETSWLPARGSRGREARSVDGYTRSSGKRVPLRGPIDYGEDRVI